MLNNVNKLQIMNTKNVNQSRVNVEALFTKFFSKPEITNEQAKTLEGILSGVFMGAEIKTYGGDSVRLVEGSIVEPTADLLDVIEGIEVCPPYKDGWTITQAKVDLINGCYFYLRLSKECIKEYDMKVGMQLDKTSLLAYKVEYKPKGEDEYKEQVVFYAMPVVKG